MTVKKIGSEKRFEINNFKIKIGSVDKKATKVFFVEYAARIDSNSKILKTDFCKEVKDWLVKNNFYDFAIKDKTIVDVDYPEKYSDTLTYINFKTFNCLTRTTPFSDVVNDIENTIKSSIIPKLSELIA